MAQVVPMAASTKRLAAQYALIRKSVAADCTDDEFQVYLHWAERLGLDPLRRQVYAFVFNKWTAVDGEKEDDKPKKQKERQLTLVIGIEGYRTVAAATGNYRPSDQEYEIHLTPEMLEKQALLAEAKKLTDLAKRAQQIKQIGELYPIDPANPEGIDRAVVYVWQFSHGDWHRIAGTAHWKEFAPLRQRWDKSLNNGKGGYAGAYSLDAGKEQWRRSPRNQIAKCSEAQALRKGWPDRFSNTYEHAEIDRARSDREEATALELIAQHTESERLIAVGRAEQAIYFDVGGTNHDEAFGPVQPIELGKVHDNLLAYMDRFHENPAQIKNWWYRNRYGVREFLSLVKNKQASGDDWLSIKRRYEEITANAQLVLEANAAQGQEQAA